MSKRQKSRRGSPAFKEENDPAVMYRPIVDRRMDAQSQEAQFIHVEAKKAPNSTMLPSLSNQQARTQACDKNDLALQLFFPLKTTVEI